MRRLAKHSRNDRVVSKRDYQTVEDRQGFEFLLDSRRGATLTFASRISEQLPAIAYAAGGYVRTNVATTVVATVSEAGIPGLSASIRTAPHWGRFGLAKSPSGKTLRLLLRIPPGVTSLDLWGLDSGAVRLPKGVKARREELNSPHLVPETFYLPHET